MQNANGPPGVDVAPATARKRKWIEKTKEKRIFTHSELQTSSDCNEKWRLRYGIGYRQKWLSDAIIFGKLYHRCLEGHYMGEPVGETAAAVRGLATYLLPRRDQRSEANESGPALVARVLTVFQNYRDHWRGKDWTLDYVAIDPVTSRPLIEAQFLVPMYTQNGNISKTMMLAGAIDLVVTDKRGGYYIIDYKSRDHVSDSAKDRMVLDQQLRLYAWAAKLYWGFNVRGAFYNLSRKTVPNVPNINKNGTVSVQKCDTTVDILLEVLERQEDYLCSLEDDQRKALKLAKSLDWDAYAPEIRRLSQLKWFGRYYQQYNDDDLMKIQYQIHQVALDISRRKFFPLNDAACDHWGGCPYRPVCMGLSPEELFDVVDDKHQELNLDLMKFHEPLGEAYSFDPTNPICSGMDAVLSQVNDVNL